MRKRKEKQSGGKENTRPDCEGDEDKGVTKREQEQQEQNDTHSKTQEKETQTPFLSSPFLNLPNQPKSSSFSPLKSNESRSGGSHKDQAEREWRGEDESGRNKGGAAEES